MGAGLTIVISGDERAAEAAPTRVLGLHLGRTPEAVYNKAGELGVSLKPTNQSPYGSKSKK